MDWKKTLKDNHLRATPVRVAVLKLLEQVDNPLDIQGVFGELSKENIRCDLVTVYRLMETFVSHGLVKQVNFQEGKARYEIEGEHHHHLVCEKCGSVQAIHEPCVAVSEQTVMDKYQFHITRHQLEFFGLCNKCMASFSFQ